jgi:hypothetical protein
MSSIKLPRPVPPLRTSERGPLSVTLMSGQYMGLGRPAHSDGRMRVNFRSKLGNQKLRFDRPESWYSVSKGRYHVEGRACRPTLFPCRSNKQSSPPVVDLARQSRFQMDDDGDLHEQILHIEAHIEELTDIIEECRKIILISKVAIAAGGI